MTARASFTVRWVYVIMRLKRHLNHITGGPSLICHVVFMPTQSAFGPHMVCLVVVYMYYMQENGTLLMEFYYCSGNFVIKLTYHSQFKAAHELLRASS